MNKLLAYDSALQSCEIVMGRYNSIILLKEKKKKSWKLFHFQQATQKVFPSPIYLDCSLLIEPWHIRMGEGVHLYFRFQSGEVLASS